MGQDEGPEEDQEALGFSKRNAMLRDIRPPQIPAVPNAKGNHMGIPRKLGLA